MASKLKPIERFDEDVQVGDLVRIVGGRSPIDVTKNIVEYVGYFKSSNERNIVNGRNIILSVSKGDDARKTRVFYMNGCSVKYEVLRRAQSS